MYSAAATAAAAATDAASAAAATASAAATGAAAAAATADLLCRRRCLPDIDFSHKHSLWYQLLVQRSDASGPKQAGLRAVLTREVAAQE